MKRPTEDFLQQQIYQFFQNTYCLKHHTPRGLIFSVPNGGTRNIREAMTMKATGLLSGVSDLIVFLPNGKMLFVELKLQNGRQSDNQKDFEKRVDDLGYPYHIIRSLEQFKELINVELSK